MTSKGFESLGEFEYRRPFLQEFDGDDLNPTVLYKRERRWRRRFSERRGHSEGHDTSMALPHCVQTCVKLVVNWSIVAVSAYVLEDVGADGV
jgi:hypothetical protein